MNPGVLILLVTAVAIGDPRAPLLALLVVLAPLGALLVTSLRGEPVPGLTVIAGAIAVGAVLAGSVADAVVLGVAVGAPADQALMLAVALMGVGALAGGRLAVGSVAATLGVLALAALAALMATSASGSPWQVWARLASRPALLFSTTTQWVIEGRAFARATSLAFTETQRVISVSGGAIRVVSPAPGGPTVRERRLTAGDAVTLRSGETLAVTAGTRLRFEAGKRVPAPADAADAWWAPRPAPPAHALRDALGMAVTLAGGAVALVGGARRVSQAGAVGVPLLLGIFALGAVTWGLYAAWLMPELVIGGAPLASIAATPVAVFPPETFPEVAIVPAAIAAALLLGATASLTARVGDLVAPWAARRVTARIVPILVAAASAAAAVGLVRADVDGGLVVRLGLGLAASAWAAPALCGAGRGPAVGTLVGGGAFAVIALARGIGGAATAWLGSDPALIAAPLAAVAARVAGPPRRARAAHRAGSARVGCPPEGTLPQ